MTITVCSTDRRDQDALLYFTHSDRSQKRVTLKDGRKAYGIPSRTRAGLYHLTDGSSCTCEDWTKNQASGGCAHMRAAVLYRMERAAEQAKKKTHGKYASIFRQDDDKPYCMACRRHHDTNMHWSIRAVS